MRKYSVEEALYIGDKVTSIITLVISAAVAFAIGVVLVKLLWVWTVPELFPAAVAQGLITAELTWIAAIKTVTLVAILSSTGSFIARQWGGN